VIIETVPPPEAADALLLAAGALLLLAAAAGVLLAVELLPELAQADMVKARAARPATPSIFCISVVSPCAAKRSPVRDHVRTGNSVQL
jgi:hypothetical protein